MDPGKARDDAAVVAVRHKFCLRGNRMVSPKTGGWLRAPGLLRTIRQIYRRGDGQKSLNTPQTNGCRDKPGGTIITTVPAGHIASNTPNYLCSTERSHAHRRRSSSNLVKEYLNQSCSTMPVFVDFANLLLSPPPAGLPYADSPKASICRALTGTVSSQGLR